MEGSISNAIAGSATSGVPPQSDVLGTATGISIVNGAMAGYGGYKANTMKMPKRLKAIRSIKAFTPAAIVSGGIVAPFQYTADKKYEEAKDDKEFSAKKFIGMAAPAAATSYLGAGISSNLIQAADQFRAGSSSATDIVKKTLTPSAIHAGYKREVNNVKKAFTGKGRLPGRIAKGAFGALLLGVDALQPASYVYNTLWNKNKNKNKMKEIANAKDS